MSLSPSVALARDLIRCPSVTPADAGALDVLQGFLTAAGFACTRKIFTEPGTPDVDNLFAKIGQGPPHLVFAGHTDVVPPGDAKRWRHDPFAGEIESGRLWGRGASDMKSAVAAFAVAARDFVAAHGSAKGAISFLITGDEEGASINGTAKLLDWAKEQGERFDHCIVGEPSSVLALGDMMKIGRRGSLSGRVTIEGVQGHVAYPERADNPVPKMARLVAALSDHRFDEGSAHFGASNLEFTSVDVGNPAVNVIPARATAAFNIRFNDLWTPERLENEIRSITAQAVGAAAQLDFTPCNARAFLTNPGAFVALVSRAVEEATGRKPELSTTGGTSDARFIVRDCEVVEFGLTNESIHKIDENAALDDIDGLTKVYRRILDLYFERP
ncbi:succinyl-diaminopimelate desuccinylase [Methylocystis bryophila]|uniref:Succinyl-diaminopimelate desuccinylase n=1 Tax=Methylocystis bryophila TaxID=655015 RepID=A0A1W6MR87_9HYPH|nr:succinyl-diaminopimelate desuccinylase [Methylocystis bryophila]ARN80098.1 succinyl-diaminopimelate desuccinylase [Methylocystis bryophila]BDV40029.1 succinyl-diaminopimelate desuccinylase [Methylocystis bryophila]